jgi:very-short-patch-repair endonuclease
MLLPKHNKLTIATKSGSERRPALPPPEILVWLHIKENNPNHLSFCRNRLIEDDILEIYCSQSKLAIEIGVGENETEQERARRERITVRGIFVLRLKARDIYNNFDATMETMDEYIEQRKSLGRDRRGQNKPG